MLTFIMWIILAMFSLPLAIFVLFIYPIVWLLLLPFRILGFAVSSVFEILRGLILLPFKLLRII